MRRRRLLPPLLSLLSVFLLSGAPLVSGAEEKPQAPAVAPGEVLLHSLPEDTTLLLRASNLKAFSEKLKKSPFYKLKDHPDVKPLIEKYKGEITGGLAKASQELGFDPLDLLVSLEGEWVLALGGLDPLTQVVGGALAGGQAPDVNPESIPFLVAADAGGAVAGVHEKLEKLFAYAAKRGAVREDITFKGGKIIRLSEKPEDGDAAKKPRSDGDDTDGDDDEPGAEAEAEGVNLYFGELGSRIYFSSSRTFLEAAMTRTASPGPGSLGGSSLFQESVKMTGTGDVLLYLNVKGLTTSIGGALSATLFSFFWQKAEALLFGRSFHNVAFAFFLEEKGIRETFFLNNSGASDGLPGLFKADAFPPAPPPMVPADALAYNATAFNPDHLGKLITEVVQTAQAFQGQPANVDEMSEKFLGVKLSALTQALGRRILQFGGAPQVDNPLGSQNYIVALRDEAPVKKLFEKGSQAWGLVAEKQKDRDVYSLDLGQAGEFAMTTAAKQLVVAGSKEGLGKIIDSAGSSQPGLAESPAYKAVAGFFPAQVSFASYTAPEYAARYLDGMPGTLRQYGTEGEDLERLLRAVSGVLGATVSYGLWKGAGLGGEGWCYSR